MFRQFCFSPVLSLVAAMIVSSNSALGQACCTLQGFNSGSSFGTLTDDDVLYLASHSTRSQISVQINGSDDWDRNSYIINGPQLGISIGMRRFLTSNLLLGGSISGNMSTISEIITIGGNESDVRFLNFQGRLGWISNNRRNAYWLRTIVPLHEKYSDTAFPFRTSPVSSLELGVAGTKHKVSKKGLALTFAYTASLRFDGKSENLYQFKYYGSHQFAWRYRVLNDVRPFISLHVKYGSLKPLDTPIYQTQFDATLFAYGLFGGGIEYSNKHIKNTVIRFYSFYPVLRWSNDRLPAGFEEKPVLGMVILKSFALTGNIN